MNADDADRVLPFQLQFDKPIASNIKIAEWNPEKDLLAMVTEDSKIVLHRFNWQRLWNVSPGRTITSLCWRPDGKAIAVGLEDGTISLHDVENGKLLRGVKCHTVAVVCLHWEEDRQLVKNEYRNSSAYEDRTPRFFPPAPRVPRIPGLVSGDTGFMNDDEDSYLELSNSPQQRFNILCSGDKDGSISFNIFGIFPIGKVNIHELDVPIQVMGTQVTYRLLHASICKVSLSNDLCRLTVLCLGDAVEDRGESRNIQKANCDVRGMHSLVLDTSIFWTRKNELHQVAQQASNIEELIQVIKASLSVMSKQWSDAMHTFHEKFHPLAKLIIDHGLDSSPQEEFLSLLGGARTSPPVHQFLVNSLGEAGVKRVSKVICGTGKDLQLIVLDHLQPAAEIIGFRMGELRGLSRWHARYQSIGLDENLMNDATENAGMLLVQVERFMKVLSSVVRQFSNFFNWLLKCIKMLMTEPSDQLPSSNSELVVIFLKFLYDQDPVRKLLEESEADNDMEIDVDMMQRLKEMALFGGFTDCEHLRTLAREFRQMESRFEKAFLMPFTTISRKIYCEDLLPLFPLRSSPTFASSKVPLSISYFEEDSQAVTSLQNSQQKFFNYISFRISDDSFSDITNCIGVARGCMHGLGCTKKGYTSFEAVLLSVPSGYHCVDLSLYKDKQLVVLLNGTAHDSESSGDSCMMIAQLSSLPFASISVSTSSENWKLHQLKDYVVHLEMENEKFRSIPYSVVAPLAVSASRGVGCVFAAKKRALVYILEEDEEDQASEDAE